MANTVIGTILVIENTESIPSKNGGQPFLKRGLVLDCSRYDQYTGQKYENYPRLEFSGNKCSELDNFQVGQLVEVSFVLSGRSYEKDGITKYFTSVVGYKVENYVQGQQSAQPTQSTQQVAQPESQQAQAIPVQAPPFPPAVDASGAPIPPQGEGDDLPF